MKLIGCENLRFLNILELVGHGNFGVLVYCGINLFEILSQTESKGSLVSFLSNFFFLRTTYNK